MMAAGGGKNTDFYSVMGLEPDCDATELRNAYKKLAMRWHPDKWSAAGNPKVAEECKKKFQAIQEAYSVLSDHGKRFLYDAGLYESDDDDVVCIVVQDMGNFLGEMAGMMNESKSQMSGFESFEDLQDLFMEMFEGDLHLCTGMERPDKSPAISSSSKRNCSDFLKETIRVEEIGEGSFMRSFHVPSFCMGAEGGSTQANGKARRKINRKHKAGHQAMSASMF